MNFSLTTVVKKMILAFAKGKEKTNPDFDPCCI